MTFGPITVISPGATALVGVVGPIGKTGAPGTNGAVGQQGPAVFTPIAPWVSGLTYSAGTATAPASYVAINGGSYACSVLHTSGVFATDLAAGLWTPVALQGSTGSPGVPGSTWYQGGAAPSAIVGINGDYFLRTDTCDVLFKVSGAWTVIGNLRGAAGNTIQNGTGAPASTVGVNGDFYIDTAASVLYGPKAGGAWPTQGTSLIGPRGAGTGNLNGPSSATTAGNIVLWGSNNQNTTDSGVALAALATSAQLAALPSSAMPLMDGTATAGAASTLARADHVHPTDTSRASVAQAAFNFVAGIIF